MDKSPFADSSILVSGGAGFLGRGLLRYLREQGISAKVTVYSRDEQKQYQLRQTYPEVRTVLGDILDTDRLTAVMAGHDTVLHLAALKHIPEAERDVTQAISVNVDGSRNVGWAALRTGVQRVVGVSTDKVVDPVNTYGATKMLMERMYQELGRIGPQTHFACVRYGNVVSSTGSVVPLFTDQAKRDGHLSITSERMTRFWFGVNDAVQLIEHALRPTSLPSGTVYVAKCPALGICDVAKAVLRYKGLQNVPQQVVGIRPGEKLHETLVSTSEAPWAIYDGEYIAIPPALLMTGEPANKVSRYSSDASPLLTIDEFVELIRDAEKV